MTIQERLRYAARPLDLCLSVRKCCSRLFTSEKGVVFSSQNGNFFVLSLYALKWCFLLLMCCIKSSWREQFTAVPQTGQSNFLILCLFWIFNTCSLFYATIISCSVWISEALMWEQLTPAGRRAIWSGHGADCKPVGGFDSWGASNSGATFDVISMISFLPLQALSKTPEISISSSAAGLYNTTRWERLFSRESVVSDTRFTKRQT